MTAPTPFQYGEVQYPLPAQTSGASLLSVADPLIATLLDFFAYRITTYVGDALTTAAASGGVVITSAVETKLSIDPMAIAKADQFKFPLLAVWRKRSDNSDKTTNWHSYLSKIGIAYILPPMTAAQSLRVWPILHGVNDVIDHSVMVGHDAGFDSDVRIFAEAETGRARLMRCEFSRYPFGDTMDFQAWTGELEVVELMRATTAGLPTYQGSNVSITDESVQPGNPIEMIAMKVLP